MIECLPGKGKTLSINPSTAKKKFFKEKNNACFHIKLSKTKSIEILEVKEP
jgi:hypothetical protein